MSDSIFKLRQLNRMARRLNQLPEFRTDPVFCIASDGRKITFTEPSQIEGSLFLLMEKIDKAFQSASNRQEMILACASFWLGFIGIHPFEDANGRTGKAYLMQVLSDKNYTMKDAYLLDQTLLEGKLVQDSESLYKVFNLILKEGRGRS